MTIDEAANEIAETIRCDAPSDAELVGVVLAGLARFAAARDTMWIEYRNAAGSYRDACAAPRDRRRFKTRDPALERIERARIRRDLPAHALGVEP